MEDKDRLKSVLKHLDLNQKELAESIDYSTDRVNKIINGHQEISKGVAKAISAKYKIDFNWLLTGAGAMVPGSDSLMNVIDLQARIDELETRCQRYEATIDTHNRAIEIFEYKKGNQLDTEAIIKEFEEKCEKILMGGIDKNAEKLNYKIKELEGKILKNLRNSSQDL
jgi:transcriptional regulator with XRE-family HTH domain